MGWFFWNGRSRDDVFNPTERKIYSYFDGEKTVKADPMALYKKIAGIGPELSIDIKVAQSRSKDNVKAHTQAMEKVRGIFNIKPFEEGGLTEAELQALLDHFLTYCEGVKKNSKMFTTSLPSSEASPTSTEPAVQIIQPSSGSGSTANAAFTAEPGKLPTGQPLPSESLTQT